MGRQKLYPFTFTPVLKHYIWGGRNLEKLYGRPLPPGVTAESWEIAAHPSGTAVVDNGTYAGRSLTHLYAEFGLDLIGQRGAWAQERGKFPLLIKLLDAHSQLSVQVHPDDAYAQAHEGDELGKSEMWVVLHAEPDAAVILGVTAGTTPDKFRKAIDEGDLAPCLHHIPVKKGDVVCVPSRSLHAILGGLVIAEIQQNSNITYRVYDWNRLRNDQPRAVHGQPRAVHGQPRPLHIEKAMEVINFDQIEPGLCQPKPIDESGGVRRYLLCHNQYFVTERVEMEAGSTFHGNCAGDSMEIWGVIEGNIAVNEVGLTAVQFTLLPAAMGQFIVTAENNSISLRTYLGPR